MKTILAVLVAAQTMYVAKVPSFGCTSIEEVSQLMSMRSDPDAFQRAMVEKQLYGQCVEILQGTLVEGTIETDNRILRVNAQVDPPGYEAPVDDFELQAESKITRS